MMAFRYPGFAVDEKGFQHPAATDFSVLNAGIGGADSRAFDPKMANQRTEMTNQLTEMANQRVSFRRTY